jgi:cytochrome c551/c552
MRRIPPSLSWRARLVLFALLAGCGAQKNGATPADAGATPNVDGASMTTQGLPCDVDAVLARNCGSCHSNPPQYAAPMPLVTYADLHAVAPADPDTMGTNVPVYQAVEQRIHDVAKPMPQPPNAPLSAADATVIDNWVAAGAPAGTGVCASDGGTGPDSSVAL